LTKLAAPERATKQPLAAEVLARWTTDHSYRDQAGEPAMLNRLGPAPSFEALAQTVTRDIHHRSLLDELLRLDLVSYNENLDRVSLTRNDFVPRCDSRQMLNFPTTSETTSMQPSPTLCTMAAGTLNRLSLQTNCLQNQ
jgi:hypothetical protein